MATLANGLRGGVYEVVVAVPELSAAIEHWAAFGYAPVSYGDLDAAAAQELYGLRSAVRSVRLGHGRATSGLIRLQHWRGAAGEGLAARPLRTLGSRWTVHRTHDITPALAWGRHLERTLTGTCIVGPTVHSLGRATASINYAVLTPLFRHVLVVRHGIEVPLYGTPAATSLLGASEVAHAGVVISAARTSSLSFYRLLGFKPVSERRVAYDPDSVATQMFPLQAGEALVEHDFDDPLSEPGPGQLPGRLRAFVLEPGEGAPMQTTPGAAGYNLYTVRHRLFRQTDDMVEQLAHLGAAVLGTGRDEFGVNSCRFQAPDGYQWLGLPAE